MKSELKALGESRRWRLMVDAALAAAKSQGMLLERMPGRGLSNVWELKVPGKPSQTVSVRTTMDRWYAFPPLEGGTKWKTLHDADVVIVASVNNKETPSAIEVYRFPASEVRSAFDAAYAARTKAGQIVKDNFGMWVALDVQNDGLPRDVGSGLAKKYPPIATYPLGPLIEKVKADIATDDDLEPSEAEMSEAIDEPRVAAADAAETIADVVRYARERIAKIAGVSADAVKLDLKLEI